MSVRSLLPPPAMVLLAIAAMAVFLGRSEAPKETTISGFQDLSSEEGGALGPLPHQAATAEQLAAIVDRPLFREARSRKKPEPIIPAVAVAPPREEPTPTSVPVPTVPAIELVGIVKVAEERRALISRDDSDLQTWSSIGDAIDGWVISIITHNAITLRHADVSHTIPLFQ